MVIVSMRARSLLPVFILGLVADGCGPAPYSLGPEEPAVVEAPDRVGGDRQTPASGDRGPPDRWIPNGLPRPNPFADHPLWVGEYECAQGWTRMELRILDARTTQVRATFAFDHAGTAEYPHADGEYLMSGRFDETSGHMTFRPGRWIRQPENYVTVGMSGDVSLDGRRFTGRILGPGCKSFGLHAVDGAP
jgi:hypothetical protein